MPELDPKALKEISKELHVGDLIRTLQRINSDLSGEDNDKESTADHLFFVFGRTTREIREEDAPDIVTDLKILFRVQEPRQIYGAFQNHHIGTLKEFTEKVLNGDKSLLKQNQHTNVVKQLKNYLAYNPLKAFYIQLLGEAKSKGFRLVFMAGKIAYYATYLLQIALPLWSNPLAALSGAAFASMHYSSPTLQRCVAVVTRNSYLTFVDFIGDPSFLISSYNSADIFGKMRILSLKLVWGEGILELDFLGIPVGSFLVGSALTHRLIQAVRERRFSHNPSAQAPQGF